MGLRWLYSFLDRILIVTFYRIFEGLSIFELKSEEDDESTHKVSGLYYIRN